MSRLYVHHFTGTGCEAAGCGARIVGLYQRGSCLVRACSPQCATAADLQMSEAEAREIEAEGWTDMPYYEEN